MQHGRVEGRLPAGKNETNKSEKGPSKANQKAKGRAGKDKGASLRGSTQTEISGLKQLGGANHTEDP